MSTEISNKRVIEADNIDPCPFCGNPSEDFLDFAQPQPFMIFTYYEGWGYSSALFCGHCETVGPRVLQGSDREAIEAWNQRRLTKDTLETTRENKEALQKARLQNYNTDEIQGVI